MALEAVFAGATRQKEAPSVPVAIISADRGGGTWLKYQEENVRKEEKNVKG